MEVFNETFKTGEVYQGGNGRFEVVGIKLPGTYKTESGGIYRERRTKVVFLHQADGKRYEVSLPTAQRLQLQKILEV